MEGPYQKEVAAERKVLRHLLFQVQIFIPTEHLGELVKPRLDAFECHLNLLHNYYVCIGLFKCIVTGLTLKTKLLGLLPHKIIILLLSFCNFYTL